MDLPPPSSRATGVRSRVNANTLMGGPSLSQAGLAPQDLRAAYAEALSAHRGLPAMTERGYRLFHVGESRRGWLDLIARPQEFVVLGRHSRCDLSLDGDPRVALRHLLARAEPATDGARPTLRLFDLHTQLGFHLDESDREDSLAIAGAVAIQVGRHALVALPSGPGIADAPPELPPLMVDPVAPLVAPAASAVETGPVDSSRSESGWTHVTFSPRISQLHDLRSTGSRGGGSVRDLAAYRPFARLEIEGPAGGESVDVTLAELRAGLLIGRASKCDKRFTRLLDDKVSRAHVLILSESRGEGGAASPIVAFDLASTNGTYEGDKRRRCVVLPETRPASLRIGLGDVDLRWVPSKG